MLKNKQHGSNPNYDIREYKRSLREKYKKVRAAITDEERAAKNAAITERFLRLHQYKSCRTLLTYVSIGAEADTFEIIRAALADGKRVAVPKSYSETRQMRFFLINSVSELLPGTYGVPEPDETRCEQVVDFDRCLCIVPALTYDLQGYRMGYGKGYYDRFLKDFDGYTVGLAFTECLSRYLPRGRFDAAVDLIVTDKRVIRTRGAQ